MLVGIRAQSDPSSAFSFDPRFYNVGSASERLINAIALYVMVQRESEWASFLNKESLLLTSGLQTSCFQLYFDEIVQQKTQNWILLAYVRAITTCLRIGGCIFRVFCLSCAMLYVGFTSFSDFRWKKNQCLDPHLFLPCDAHLLLRSPLL